MGAVVGAPFTMRRIAGRMLMKMVGGSFLTSVTGGAFVFFTLATRRSSEMVMVAAGLRNVFINWSIWAVVAGSSEGKETLVISRIAEEDGVVVHIDRGLHLDSHHPDMALAARRRQSERHARVNLLVVLPVVNLRLVKNELSARFGDGPRPSRTLCPAAAETGASENRNKEIVGSLRNSQFCIGSTTFFAKPQLAGLRGNKCLSRKSAGDDVVPPVGCSNAAGTCSRGTKNYLTMG